MVYGYVVPVVVLVVGMVEDGKRNKSVQMESNNVYNCFISNVIREGCRLMVESSL